MKTALRNLIFCLSILFNLVGFAQQNPWQQTHLTSIPEHGEFKSFDKADYYTLDLEGLRNTLASAPLRARQLKTSDVKLVFPNTAGRREVYSIFEAPTFSKRLSTKYPRIKSYIGYSKSGAIIRFSLDHKGLQATIIDVDRTTAYIQYFGESNNYYAVYNSDQSDLDTAGFSCTTPFGVRRQNTSSHQRDANDQLLRIYRLAVSATGEYTQYHGGTVADALAAINATITRVNMIFETDIAATFQIQDFDQLIYTNSITDPYSDFIIGSDPDNFATSDWWGVQLQNTLSSAIGNSAYDIGHLFATNSAINGNAGCIGCVCTDDDTLNSNDMNKGAAFTSSDNPQGEYFDIVVAHEFGHQMGANHTFSFIDEGTMVNSEPGSGSTLMSYAGIAGNNNIQIQPDPYFHYHSIKQMTDNFASSNCWQSNSPMTITNNPPVANAGSDYTIPIGTAYKLLGSATDADTNDDLSYCWEGINTGSVTNDEFGPAWNQGSMVRSLPPNSNPIRYIPNLTRVINNQLTETNPGLNSDWETVSNIQRILDYALTVRDRSAVGVGLSGQTSYDTMQVTVDDNAGPFLVTSQTTNDLWYVDSEQTITWDVAGTDGGNVNTPEVNILLSLDGGLSFPVTLASSIPNSGMANVTIPDLNITTITNARIIVEGHGNIFFAMNSSDFTIEKRDFILETPETSVSACQPQDATFNFTYDTFLSFGETVTFSAPNLPSGASISFNPANANSDNTNVIVTISNLVSLSTGDYSFDIVATASSSSYSETIELSLFDTVTEQPNLMSPMDTSSDQPTEIAFNWSTDSNAEVYLFELSEDQNFNTLVSSQTTEIGSTQIQLEAAKTYYWRVTSENACGAMTSEISSFSTATCFSFGDNSLPISISDQGGATYTSSITVGENLLISDIDIAIDITHSFTADLDISITSPGGTTVNLSSDNGGDGQNYTNTVFDQEATQQITSGSAPFSGRFIPEGDLSQFYNTMSSGEWIITIVDDAFGDGGSINNVELMICTETFSLDFLQTSTAVCSPDNATFTFDYAAFNGYSGITTFEAQNLPNGASISFSPSNITTVNSTITATVTGTGNLDAGNYNFSILGSNPVETRLIPVELNIFETIIDPTQLLLPEDNGLAGSDNITFQWSLDSNHSSYFIEVATDQNFGTIVESASVDTNTFVTSLEDNTTYFWRVTPSNTCNSGPSSDVFTFDTLGCFDYDATDLWQTIPGNMVATLTSEIEITDDISIQDINVRINIIHSVRAQLDITLTSPTGTVIELSTGNPGVHYINTVFDQEATTSITSDMGPSTGNFIPEGDLSTLYNTSAQGTWTLTVVDNVVGVGGDLRNFSLNICAGVPLSVEDDDFNSNALSIFPNPNKGTFNITSTLPMDVTDITIFDINGRMIHRTIRNKSMEILNEEIALNQIESGVYLIQIEANATKIIRRIIINK
ncbi:MAG: reprolysin-like metallopeptidase [Bacteroidota bacterium]